MWLATASPDGQPYVVPLSLAWDGERVLVATAATTPTARNAGATGRARAHLDDVYDVVIVSGGVEVIALDHADSRMVERYVASVGWDPRDESGDWVLLVLTPELMLVWNSVGSMRAGSCSAMGGGSTTRPRFEQVARRSRPCATTTGANAPRGGRVSAAS